WAGPGPRGQRRSPPQGRAGGGGGAAPSPPAGGEGAARRGGGGGGVCAKPRANPRSMRWAPAPTKNPSLIVPARARPPAAPACAAAGGRGGADMPRVVGIDHLVLSVGDFARSQEFYRKLL